MQPLDLDAQFGAQLGVEVRERLVEQKHAGVAHQRAADRDALALAAGQLGRPAVEQVGDLQHLGSRASTRRSISARGMPRNLQAERHVAAHGHARIERVGLEHHGDAAILRLVPGDVAAADPDLARHRCRVRPAMALSSVDLPQPDGPSSTRNSDCATSRSRSIQHA